MPGVSAAQRASLQRLWLDCLRDIDRTKRELDSPMQRYSLVVRLVALITRNADVLAARIRPQLVRKLDLLLEREKILAAGLAMLAADPRTKTLALPTSKQ